MLKVLAVFSLAAACFGSPLAAPSEGDKLSPPIVGGGPVDIEDFPYQLAFDAGGGFCGASIISENWVLTAAHCIMDISTNIMRLRAGSTQRADGGSLHYVLQKLVHPEYLTSTGSDYDFALLQVDPPFAWRAGVAAVPLADAGVEFPAGVDAVVSGWGSLRPGADTLPAILQAVEVPLTSASACQEAYGADAITDRMICAGLPEGGKDSCQGDSGGPLVVDGTQVGIVSWGKGCAEAGFPGVYAKVAAARDWIKSIAGV